MDEWIEKAKRGDPAAWEHIFEQYRGMAFAVAYERIGDVQLAEDAVQEAFAEVFDGLKRLEHAEAFPGWLRTIVKRKAVRPFRRKQLSTLPIGEEAERAADEGSNTERIVEFRELKRKLYNSVDELSEGQRTAVRLYYFEGYSIRDIARFLDLSESALKKRLFDARIRLKSALHVSNFSAAFRDLYEGGKGMLHIVNGDRTAALLREAEIQGEVLVWRELYPFGPVFADMEEASAKFSRADYLEKELGIPRSVYLEGCAEQERKLRGLGNYEEVVLWFEHDLFDQTMLTLLLDRIRRLQKGRTRVSLLCIGEFPGIECFHGLGQLRADQLKTLSGTWQPVGEEQYVLSSSFWKAYSSPDPEEHARFLKMDSSALPFAHAAFEAHLSRLPSPESGLGIIQRTTLEAAASGAAAPGELFREVSGRLSLLGIGDLEFWRYLELMTAGSHPLLICSGSNGFPKYGQSQSDFTQARFSLSELGRRVLEGEAAAEDGGFPDWVGGLRLTGGQLRYS
ncbi:sigma-70 family RNA polymerase sigma factor [Saccharibacillus kuerlensis]|uniref:Sigma-70 family RNA polymerase sigma factor n=1 Tax=Saccharibacillus kuerlensis TaxID=459527 RepID=A0ABQ2KXC0_9BACL|nr:sigma-70 family RNA polymerase sigma factor [Saccharibacillus kuerlensis]GGN94342.1 hypothetical protein GCM10010969_09000 [Saccharibacillus kuerlensis]